MDTPEAIERAAEIGMLAGLDLETARTQLGAGQPTLSDRADAHLASLKRDAKVDPYRPASRRALSLPAAIRQAEIVADLARAVESRDA